MELNFTKDGPYKIMAKHGDFVTIYNRFNTLEEANYVIDSHYKLLKSTNRRDAVTREINKEWEFWLEIENEKT